jgi:DNA-binding HxlR family transcriptional regulator
MVVAPHQRSFGHFCAVAMALGRVGDRWTLLVVRDLLAGPRRFTDLSDRLAGITPKTLAQRLRDLEQQGLVEVDRVAGRREVWYRLTAAGRDLEPILEELAVWGLRHAIHPWQPGEPAHPEHLFMALRIMLEREKVDPGAVSWVIRFADDGSYVIRHSDDEWTVAPGDVEIPDVTATTTRDGWARFLSTPPGQRSLDGPDVQVSGDDRAVDAFREAIAVFPFGRAS